MYATGANSVADDGAGRNGLFTGHLLNNLRTQGLSVFDIFDRTMDDVISATNGRQHPELSLRFPGAARAFLGPRPVAQTAPVVATQPVATTAPAQPAVAHGPTLPAPRNLRAVPENNWIDLSWDNAGSGLIYIVYYSTLHDSSVSIAWPNHTVNTWIRVSDLSPGTTYFFWVSALRDGQESEKSTAVHAVSHASGLPAAAQSTTAQVPAETWANPLIRPGAWRVSSGRADSTGSVNVSKEVIEGRQRDVLTMEIRYSTIDVSGPMTMIFFTDGVSFRQGSGLRFRALGDGRPWRIVLFTRSLTGQAGWYYSTIRTRRDRVVDFNVPYSRFLMSSGTSGRLDRSRITGVQFYRGLDDMTGTSTLKIFDFEIIP
jgi:hypothetical protein